MEWVYLAIGWVFLNVVIKLFVNSIERIHRDRIDNLVLKTPEFARILGIETFRVVNLIFLLPTILPFWIIPPLGRIKRFEDHMAMIDFLMSKKRFRRTAPVMFYLMRHPITFVSKQHRELAVQKWRQQVMKDPKLLNEFKDSPP